MPLPPIFVQTIMPSHQRYATVGDWINPSHPSGAAQIKVSDTGNPDYNFLLAFHELVEWYLCYRAGITQEEVDAFDQEWERHHVSAVSEPGDDPAAPYHRQHEFASVVERALAHHMGVNWNDYEDALNRAYQKTKRALKRISETERKASYHATGPGEDS